MLMWLDGVPDDDLDDGPWWLEAVILLGLLSVYGLGCVVFG